VDSPVLVVYAIAAGSHAAAGAKVGCWEVRRMCGGCVVGVLSRTRAQRRMSARAGVSAPLPHYPCLTLRDLEGVRVRVPVRGGLGEDERGRLRLRLRVGDAARLRLTVAVRDDGDRVGVGGT
jgi:hypothetical protein